MSISNQGKPLQNQVLLICQHYEQRGIAKIHKVDPPVRLLGTGRRRKTIFLPNPYLDFVGVMGPGHSQAGRMITLEAKSTEDHRLEIGKGGITEAQMKALAGWHQAGAMVGVLWGHQATIRFVPLDVLHVTLLEGRKSVKWHEATQITPGTGYCTHDFLATLTAWYGFVE